MENLNDPATNSKISTQQHVTIQIVVDGFPFTFSLPVGATLGTALNAAFSFLSHIDGLIHETVTKSQPQQTSDTAKDS